MLRILILVSACIQTMATTDQRDPYIWGLPPKHKVMHTTLPSDMKPVTTKPVEPVITDKKYSQPNMNAHILKSLELLENKINEDVVKVNDLLANIKPDQIRIPLVNRTQKRETPVRKPVNSSEKEQIDDSQQCKSQVLTEKPVEPVRSDDNRLGHVHNPNLPVSRKPVSSQLHKESILKGKLMSLLMSSEKDVKKQTKHIKSIHDTFKSGAMYKVGYLTSLINKMNNRLNKLYSQVQRNSEEWDALRLLETYEEVKKDNELIQELLQMMRAFLRVNSGTNTLLSGPGPRNSPQNHPLGISWSYYDDSMM